MDFKSITDMVLEGAPMEELVKQALFLKTPFNLGKLIPCVGNIPFNFSKHGGMKEYDKAKENVLFKGFYFENSEWTEEPCIDVLNENCPEFCLSFEESGNILDVSGGIVEIETVEDFLDYCKRNNFKL